MMSQAISSARRVAERVEAVRRRASVPPYTSFWMAQGNYRIGALIVMLLRSTPITANWVTLASLVVHVVGAIYVASLTEAATLSRALVLLVIWQ